MTLITMDAEDLETQALKHITLEGAADRQAEFVVAERAYQLATERRNAAVLALLRRGTRNVEVARALNISPGRVAQMAMNARRAAQRRQDEQRKQAVPEEVSP